MTEKNYNILFEINGVGVTCDIKITDDVSFWYNVAEYNLDKNPTDATKINQYIAVAKQFYTKNEGITKKIYTFINNHPDIKIRELLSAPADLPAPAEDEVAPAEDEVAPAVAVGPDVAVVGVATGGHKKKRSKKYKRRQPKWKRTLRR